MVKMCKYTAWLLILCTVFLFVGPTAQAAQLGNTYISAKGACLLDFESGEVLYAHNANEKYVPAYLLKLCVSGTFCAYPADYFFPSFSIIYPVDTHSST